MKFYSIIFLLLISGTLSYAQVFEPNFSNNKATEKYTGSYLTDVNRDSFPDILYSDSRDIYLYLNKGLDVATFEKIHLGADQSTSKTFHIWDTDLDGDIDILAGVEGKITLFENQSEGNLVKFVKSNKDFYYFGSTSKNVPVFKLAYINEDTLYDMVIAYGKTKISFQKPDKTFYDYEIPKAQYTKVRKVEVLDIDQDKKQDLLFCKLGSEDESGLYYFLNGNNTFSFQKTIMNGAISDFQFYDFNHDGSTDILTAKGDSLGLISLIENIDHDTIFTIERLNFSSSQEYNAMAIGELNGYPGLDIITATEATTDLTLLLNQKENQPLWDQKLLTTTTLTKNLHIADLDHDGDDDIIQMLPDDGFVIYERVRITKTDEYTSNLKIYPNPFTHSISLLSPTEWQIMDIININGKMVYHQVSTREPESKITLDFLTDGYYIAILRDLYGNVSRIPLIKTN